MTDAKDEKIYTLERVLLRLENDLERKDDKIYELETALTAAERVVKTNTRWCLPFDAGKLSDQTLPVPRLELRWTPTVDDPQGYRWECRYALIYLFVPSIGEGTCAGIPISSTRSSRGYYKDEIPLLADGRIDAPRRDGVHIQHDMLQLGLPGFLVLESRTEGAERIQEVEITEFASSCWHPERREKTVAVRPLPDGGWKSGDSKKERRR